MQFTLFSARSSRATLLSTAPLGLLALLLGACGSFPDDGSDADAYMPPSTYSPSSSSTPSSSNSGTYSTPGPSNSSSPSYSAANASYADEAEEAEEADEEEAYDEADDGAVCGSNCSNEQYVRNESARCGSGPTQGPCYCAAALLYFCFFVEGCYAEAGAPTSLSGETLAAGMVEELTSVQRLGYTCEYRADGEVISLNDTFADYLPPSGARPASSDPDAQEAEDDSAPDETSSTPSRGCGGSCPAGKVCACVAL